MTQLPAERQPEPNQVAHVALTVSYHLDEPAPEPRTAERVYRRRLEALRGWCESADLGSWNKFRAEFGIEVAVEVQDWKKNRSVVSDARAKAKRKLEDYSGRWNVHDDGEVLERLAF